MKIKNKSDDRTIYTARTHITSRMRCLQSHFSLMLDILLLLLLLFCYYHINQQPIILSSYKTYRYSQAHFDNFIIVFFSCSIRTHDDARNFSVYIPLSTNSESSYTHDSCLFEFTEWMRNQNANQSIRLHSTNRILVLFSLQF